MELIRLEPDPWPERKKEVRDNEWRFYEKLLAACELGIDRLLSEPDDMLSPAELSRLLDLADRLGRLAAGLPKESTAHDIHGEDNRTVRVEIAAAIKKIYSQPIETLALSMGRLPQRIDSPPG